MASGCAPRNSSTAVCTLAGPLDWAGNVDSTPALFRFRVKRR
jgi:hypothetical protein